LKRKPFAHSGGMPPAAAAPRLLTLDLTPVEVAARCRHLPGLVFFDTARESDERAISIVAAAPSETIRGRDWDELRRRVVAHERSSAVDDGLPHGLPQARSITTANLRSAATSMC
jgi:hypothetical protein